MAGRMSVRSKDRERGFVVVAAAALMVVLLGFLALGADVGLLLSERTSTQQIADAAALAGAFTFISDPTAAQPQTAIAHAIATATSNSLGGESVTAADLEVNVDLLNQRVTVTMLTAQPTFFGRVLGIDSADVGATATAEAGRDAALGRCPKPWFMPNTIVSSEEPCEACANGETLIDPDTGAVTPYAQSVLGTQVLVKPQIPTDALAPSQFYAVDVNGQGGGAAEYRDAIGDCVPPVMCAETQDVQTGNMVGPTRQGVGDLIGNPPRDTYQDIGEYLINGTTLSDVSDALVIAPIWDTCNFPGFCPGQSFPSGTRVEVPIQGFALLFIEGFQPGNQGNLIARLINVSGCKPGGAGGFGEDETSVSGSEVYSYPLRLVRTPPVS